MVSYLNKINKKENVKEKKISELFCTLSYLSTFIHLEKHSALEKHLDGARDTL
jgi:hypothetical protein